MRKILRRWRHIDKCTVMTLLPITCHVCDLLSVLNARSCIQQIAISHASYHYHDSQPGTLCIHVIGLSLKLYVYQYTKVHADIGVILPYFDNSSTVKKKIGQNPITAIIAVHNRYHVHTLHSRHSCCRLYNTFI